MHGAVQCGFCVSGMIMQASVLLRKNSNPSEAQIREAITVICRCGIYPRVIEAIQRAGRALRGEEVIPAGFRPGIDPADSARQVPALAPPRP